MNKKHDELIPNKKISLKDHESDFLITSPRRT